MFQEKRILKKLLFFFGIVLIVFAIVSGVWYFKYGVLNQRYMLDGMEKESGFSYDYQCWNVRRDYATFRIIKQPFLAFSKDYPMLILLLNKHAFGEFFPNLEGEIEVDGNLMSTRFQMTIFPAESIESGQRFLIHTIGRNLEKERTTSWSFGLDAEGNPVIEEEYENQNPENADLIRKYCQEQKEVFRKAFEVAAKSWGEGILK